MRFLIAVLFLSLLSCKKHEQPYSVTMEYSRSTPIRIDTVSNMYKVYGCPDSSQGTIRVTFDSITFSGDENALNMGLLILGFSGDRVRSRFVCLDDKGDSVAIFVHEKGSDYVLDMMNKDGGFTFDIDTVK